MRILDVTPGSDHTSHVIAEHGTEGSFDGKTYLEDEAFMPLHDQDEFMKVRTGGYFIEWPSGADLSADTLVVRRSRIECSIPK